MEGIVLGTGPVGPLNPATTNGVVQSGKLPSASRDALVKAITLPPDSSVLNATAPNCGTRGEYTTEGFVALRGQDGPIGGDPHGPLRRSSPNGSQTCSTSSRTAAGLSWATTSS